MGKLRQLLAIKSTHIFMHYLGSGRSIYINIMKKAMIIDFIPISGEMAQMVKCLPTMQETWVQSLSLEDLLEKEMAIHSSILTWKIS